MRTTGTRVPVLVLLITIATGGLCTTLLAQQSATAAMVGVTGSAAGGPFAGTLVITRFDSQAADNAIVAVGTVSGVVNGRNVVTPVAIPVAVTASDPQACDAVHLALTPAAIRAPGGMVTLNATSLDITSSGAPTPALVVGGSAAPAGVGVSGTNTTASLPGTVVPMSPVAGSATPGVISPIPQEAVSPTAAPSPQDFGQLLCSVSTLSQSVSSRAGLVPLLNEMLGGLTQ